MPPVEWGGYLLEWLMDCGPVMSGAAGATALTHSEIRAWSLNCGIPLRDGEASALRVLSADYAGALHDNPERAPYVAPKD